MVVCELRTSLNQQIFHFLCSMYVTKFWGFTMRDAGLRRSGIQIGFSECSLLGVTH
jgi:hypothetical protein